MNLGVRQETVGDGLQGATDSELAGHCKQMVYPKKIAVLSNWVLASNLAERSWNRRKNLMEQMGTITCETF